MRRVLERSGGSLSRLSAQPRSRHSLLGRSNWCRSSDFLYAGSPEPNSKRVAALAGGAFADLGPEPRTEVAATFREVGGSPLAALVRVVLLCYYRDDRVM